MTEPAESFKIIVRFGDSLRDQIENGSTDSLGWIDTVRAGDQLLIGGGDNNGMKEYLTSFFGGLLQGVAKCLRGEDAVFRTGNGPLYLALEPVSQETIRFSICYSKESAYSREARKPYEPTAVIGIDPLVEEVLATAIEFEEFVSETNSDLAAESDDYRGLREDMGRVRETWSE